MEINFIELQANQPEYWLLPAIKVFMEAMQYPPESAPLYIASWLEQTKYPGWKGYAAVLAAPENSLPSYGNIVGVTFGYTGDKQQWWHRQVAAMTNKEHKVILNNYFSLAELHVLTNWQKKGLGKKLLDLALSHRTEPYALLSTPEVSAENNGAWKLYRKSGFIDIKRNFKFSGDARPFAILGRKV